MARSAKSRPRSPKRSSRSSTLPALRTTRAREVLVVQNPVSDQLAKTKATSFAMFREEAAPNDWAGIGQESWTRMLLKYGRSTSWVYIAVNKNAASTAQIPITLIDKRREGKPNAFIRNHPLVDLLETPNPFQSLMEFIEHCVISLELTGNLYIEKFDSNGDGLPEALYVLNPALIQIVPDPEQYVRGYVYQKNNGEPQFLRPDQVLHIKYANPTSEYYGLSRLTAARIATETDRAGSEWNRTFLLKGGWPGGAIETDNEPDGESLKRTKRQIKKSLSAGKDSAGRILLLTGGMKYKALAVAPKDADWINARRLSRDEIFSIFGMTPAVAGVFSNENTTTRSAGVEQQIKQYYRSTPCSLMKRFLDAFNRDFVKLFGKNLKLVPDLRNVPALQDDIETELARAQALRTLTSAGLSLNKGLARLYPEVEPEKWGDAAWFNSGMIAITGPENPVLQGPDATQKPTGPAGPTGPSNGNGSSGPSGAPTKPPKKELDQLVELRDEVKRLETLMAARKANGTE